MAEQIFTSLSIIIGIVLVSAGLMKVLKQPMIIGFIIAGTAIGICFPGLLHANTSFHAFGNLGIALLLFMVGMELSPTIIRDIGKDALIGGIRQVVITGAIGYGIAIWLGMETMTALFLAIGLAFSSTIVVLKLLGDRDEMEFTYGRLTVGILIIQDIIVMLLMIGIATCTSITHGEGSSYATIAIIVAKIIGAGGIIYIISRYIIPKITKKIAESQEFLFLFSIGRCFILGTVFYRLGFGIEIGALVAGITLANSAYRFEISSRIKPLKDFFIVIFFVLLGSQVDFGAMTIQSIVPGVILSTYILIIKPIITMTGLGLLGHTRKNSFLAGISLGQISEFSFIIMAMGISAGYIKDPIILSLTTLLGLISIAGSSYFITYGEKLYQICKPILGILPGVWKQKHKKKSSKKYEILLFGYGRFGHNIYHTLHKTHKNILVIDENPAIINHLQHKNISCKYGDASDIEFIEELDIAQSKMAISTVKRFDENIILLKTLKQHYPKLIVILVSNHIQEAIKLYEQGADYVILPHYIGVDHTSLMLEEYGFDIQRFMENKKTLVHNLKNRHQDLMIEALQK